MIPAYDFADNDDPKHLVFTLARYKHTAKMLAGYERVLEVGCDNGFKSRIVRQHVGALDAFDIDPKMIAAAIPSARFPINFTCRDALTGSSYGSYDACYSLDVLEHIPQEKEAELLGRLALCAPVCVIGTPSKESQAYASPRSKEGHINCKSGEELRALCKQYWRHVFMFTLHDETLGTSYLPMAQYLLALCVA